KSRNGKTVKDRIEAAGYKLAGLQSYSYGENIAAGQRSIDQVMSSWIKSPGHCKNLMNPNFTEIGVAQANYYWVQNFGMRKSFAGKMSASN
ncbi:MAG TPA: CAP domain-containing protein, partial [Sphingobacteriaceae bacterium]